MPARSISRCETISASRGFSFRMGRKNCVREEAAPESARLACLPRLHSYFVTEWKPDRPHRPEIAKIDSSSKNLRTENGNAYAQSAEHGCKVLTHALRV